ncbi:MAG: glycoside hydrolase family 9 protein [Planctomycetota bacterium]|nr:MAG: glycoside hydrolase family 9 protein [Planctomycetota bacterium]
MPIEQEKTAINRWLNKPVLESRLLDDMDDPCTWSHRGYGRMTFTQERPKRGAYSLRLTAPTFIGRPGQKPVGESELIHGFELGRPPGAAIIRRNFGAEDWSDYNRLSFWVYPTLPGFRVISMSTILYNDGQQKSPGPYQRNGRNYFLLKPDCWNNIIWEIAHLPRDSVVGVEFIYRLQGNEPGAVEDVCYDIDNLELQQVSPDHFEGWDVTPGKIAFSHTGYLPSLSKSAIASGIKAESFSLINAVTGSVGLTKSIRTLKAQIGEFQVIDFSEISEPGTYVIQAGGIKTQPFRIHDKVWYDTIWKTINFFFCERCGTRVPGIHDVCHRDWQAEYNNKRIVLNGGWHDAGDLSQSAVNTAQAVYAMLSLAETLTEDEPVLAQRLIEEARWGLDWLLKTRFGDGYRSVWATMDFWTDGIIGTIDDVAFEAENEPYTNYRTASAEALAARVMKEIDPVRSSFCLKAAEQDWQFAAQKAQAPDLQLASAAVSTSMDLFEVTGRKMYSDKALELAHVILDSQQRTPQPRQIPLIGFFYTNPQKTQLLHYNHKSHEHMPIVALTQLCRSFPDHPDRSKWYSAVVLYSQYLKTISKFTEPYAMLPNSIYSLDESSEPTFRQQVLNGIRLGRKHYLRLFPVWHAFRGNNGTILAQAKALSAAARLTADSELADLSQKQLQWAVGRNPFVQSTMYGEGYDYAPQYTAMSGDMVGSLAVGIQTRGDEDKPYWPADNCYNFKEVWVYPSSLWLWILSDLYATPR